MQCVQIILNALARDSPVVEISRYTMKPSCE